MAKNKRKRPMEHVEIDDHRIDPEFFIGDGSTRRLPNSIGRLPCKRPAIKAYMAALRNVIQVPDKHE